MAEVFEAVITSGPYEGAPVAVKRIHAREASEPAAQRMIADEAAILSRLEHHGIVRVLDRGELDGSEAIVLELVEGVDAAQAIRVVGALPPEPIAAHIVAEVAEALAYAHALTDEHGATLGIVHRDVTPSNLLLAWDGSVKLGDFGIARAAIRSERTATGVVKGKEGFVAPEQATGGVIGPATDAYGLGATLHTLISGAPPCTSFAAAARRFGGGPLPISPLLSVPAAALVTACMQLDPRARLAAPEIARRARAIAGDARVRVADLAAWLAPAKVVTAHRGDLDDLLDPMRVPTTQ
jgi:serine/threonine-protein kinase